MKQFTCILILGLTLLYSFSALAQDEWKERWSPLREEMDTARPLAMGRSFIAIAKGTSTYFFNPAGIAQDREYWIGADTEIDPYFKDNHVHASLLDSITSPLCAQVGYTFHGYDSQGLWNESDMAWLAGNPYYRNENRQPETNYRVDSLGRRIQILDDDDPNEVVEITDFRHMFGRYKNGFTYRHIPRISLAGKINDYFMLGATGKYIYVDRPDRHTVNSGNVDIGMMIKTGVGLNIGLVGYNLIHSAYDLWPLKLGAGIAYTMEGTFSITYDQIVMFDVYGEDAPSNGSIEYKEGTQLAFRAGAEYIIAGMVPLRVGYEHDTWTGNHYISGGLAYLDPTFSISLSYNQGAVDKEERLIGFSFQVKI